MHGISPSLFLPNCDAAPYGHTLSALEGAIGERAAIAERLREELRQV